MLLWVFDILFGDAILTFWLFDWLFDNFSFKFMNSWSIIFVCECLDFLISFCLCFDLFTKFWLISQSLKYRFCLSFCLVFIEFIKVSCINVFAYLLIFKSICWLIRFNDYLKSLKSLNFCHFKFACLLFSYELFIVVDLTYLLIKTKLWFLCRECFCLFVSIWKVWIFVILVLNINLQVLIFIFKDSLTKNEVPRITISFRFFSCLFDSKWNFI